MCARYVIHHSAGMIARLFGGQTAARQGAGTGGSDQPTEGPGEQIDANYNTAPTDEVIVIVRQDGERELVRMEFGLVPHWLKDARNASRPVNARVETIFERPYFSDAVRQRRCLVPMSGYYEWEKVGKERRPYYICRKDREPFVVAGIWEEWGPPANPLRTVATLTIPANAMLRPIHDRMLGVLDEREAELWLDAATPAETAVAMLQPRDLPEFEKFRVSPRVNRVGVSDPDCIAPYIEPPTDQASLFDS